MSATTGEAAGARSAAQPAPRADARPAALRHLHRRGHHRGLLGRSARCSAVIWCPMDPYADDLLNSLDGPSADHWFGTDQPGPRHLLPGHRRRARHPHRGAACHHHRHHARHGAGAGDRLFPRLHRRCRRAHRRCVPCPAAGHHRPAGPGGARHLQHDGGGRDRRRLRPHHRAHRARGGAVGARARLCGGGGAARRERAPHHVRRDPAQCDAADPGRDPRCAWAMRSSPWPP